MNDSKTTPRDFFLWVGAMVALYAGVVSLISLIFDYINYAFPDPLRYWLSDPYSGSAPYEMASLIVLAPVFLLLMRVIRRGILNDTSRREIWIRRWALFLTVFLAGATIVVDLIVLITTFLRGEELTIAFLLKILVVLLVAGAGFMHFLADLWGYWERQPRYAQYINYAVGVLVFATIIAGFFIIGTPQQARQMRFDTQRVNDLQSIQSQVTYYYQAKQKLPARLNDLTDTISGWQAPLDPQTKQPYEYTPKTGLSFELCATFTQAGRNPYATAPEPVGLGSSGKGFDNWQHAAGRTCFTRTIDPAFYPPTNKTIF